MIKMVTKTYKRELSSGFIAIHSTTVAERQCRPLYALNRAPQRWNLFVTPILDQLNIQVRSDVLNSFKIRQSK